VTVTGGRLRPEIDALRERCAPSAGRLEAEHGGQIATYRRLIGSGLDNALGELRAEAAQLSGGNAVVVEVAEHITSYISWMQWALWDLPVFAVALDVEAQEFEDAVVGCGLTYLAIRGFDDVIDQHFSYKGRRDTVFGAVSGSHARAQEARTLSTLAALLLCLDGLERLARSRPAIVPDVLGSLRRAVFGAMMELTPQSEWSQDDYVRMVRLKNVDYWRALYAAVDPGRASPLYPFLERYYEVAQYLNDVGDYDDDRRRGQPNLLALAGLAAQGCRPVNDPRPWAVTPETEAFLADRIAELGEAAAELDELERTIAEAKLLELIDAARALRLFADDGDETVAVDDPPRPRIDATSDLDEVVEILGRHAVADVACGVCGGEARSELFRKDGFAFHRCAQCRHVYVSPRIAAEAQHDLDVFEDDHYLDVQRFYAERICALLRHRTPGARLLDVGFGHGYILQMAHVYGFQAYGVDALDVHVDALRPLFGDHVARAVVGRDAIPWSGFDAVVLSHVLEHLAEPVTTLREIAALMSPGAWAYIAVPDVDSFDYRVFGKNWDAINPLVHLQYFEESSLRHALDAAGFEDAERVHHPHLQDEFSPRWMRLARQLGGSDSSELAMLAKLPDDPMYFPVQVTA
jgi:SAM-dependent methyltransferase